MRWVLITAVVLVMAAASWFLMSEQVGAPPLQEEEEVSVLDPTDEGAPVVPPEPKTTPLPKPDAQPQRPAAERPAPQRRPPAHRDQPARPTGTRSDAPATPPDTQRRPPTPQQVDKGRLEGFVREAGLDLDQLELTEQDWQALSQLVGERPAQLDQSQAQYRQRLEALIREKTESGDVEPVDEEAPATQSDDVIASRDVTLEDGTRGRVVVRRGDDYLLEEAAEEQKRVHEEIIDLVKQQLSGR